MGLPPNQSLSPKHDSPQHDTCSGSEMPHTGGKKGMHCSTTPRMAQYIVVVLPTKADLALTPGCTYRVVDIQKALEGMPAKIAAYRVSHTWHTCLAPQETQPPNGTQRA